MRQDLPTATYLRRPSNLRGLDNQQRGSGTERRTSVPVFISSCSFALDPVGYLHDNRVCIGVSTEVHTDAGRPHLTWTMVGLRLSTIEE